MATTNAVTTGRADYIAPDTYTGRWTTTRPAGYLRGNRTAGWLANHIGEGNTAVVWNYSGHTRDGRQLFNRTRFVTRGSRLHGYDSNGRLVIIHSADRTVGFISA